MINTISRWVKTNPALKVISLALAFLIWLTVVNFSNPDTTASQTVDLSVENGDKLTSADKIYSLDAKSVRVSYKVRTKYRNLVRASDFKAYVDLKDYSITGAVPVYVEVADNISSMISDVTSNPLVIHVTTEDLQRKRFEVGITTKGAPMEGYAAGTGSLATGSGYVYISGPVSEIGQISSVGIEVDIAEKNADVVGDDAALIYYDANGNPITVDNRISLSRETFSYLVPIYRIKSLSISAETSGEPADGYALEGIDMSPGFVQVYGPEDVLDQHVSIMIPDTLLSISGAAKNVTRSIDIKPYLPAGLTLAQPDSEITVVAKIRKLPETTTAADQEEQGGTANGENGMLPSETTRQDTGNTHETTETETRTEQGTQENAEAGSSSHNDSGSTSEKEETTAAAENAN